MTYLKIKKGHNSAKSVFFSKRNRYQLLGTNKLRLFKRFKISIFDDGTTACWQKDIEDILLQNTQRGHNSIFKLIIQIILKAGVR